eukprot:g696.t1
MGHRLYDGAHNRYFPHDMWHQTAGLKIRSAHDSGGQFRNRDGPTHPETGLRYGSDECRRAVLKDEVFPQFHPVLHFFFHEKFSPTHHAHFDALRAYTQSLAVTSIAGYVLGIGDRHTNNVILCLKTGKVVHIDFGMIFDHAAIYLPVPERVPFRLTRDFVAPLGWQGIHNGVFRKTAEQTMDTLIQHSELICSLVEVLCYDPISRWAKSKQSDETSVDHVDGANAPSNSNSRETSLQAEHCLLSLKEKLRLRAGVYDNMQFQNVPSFVDFLINKAENPDEMALMFSGWSPHC